MKRPINYGIPESSINQRLTKFAQKTFILIEIHMARLVLDTNSLIQFVDCAVAGNAKFIVTEDRHFPILKTIDFPMIDIITLDEIMPLI